MFIIIIFALKLQSRVCNLAIMNKDYIRHQGVVNSIEKHKVFVKITQKAACSDCHAKSVCLSSDRKEKIIEVSDDSGLFTLNEEVIVSVQSSMGIFAVALAFVVPLVLVTATIITGITISGDEAKSGLIGLSVLIPYYTLLYMFRNKIDKKIVFSLSKINSDIAKPLNIATF